jgi:hypothetical protein
MNRTLFTLCLTAVAALAQSPAPGTADVRYHNQQERVAQGVSSGQLTAGETGNLERRESAIRQEVRTDRALDNGRLTGAERTQINHQQNRVSNSIYADKHNATTQHYGNSEVDARRYNQQQRIASGVANGSMNAGRAANIEHKEAAINHEVRADRRANGGRLTGAEHAMVNHQQNQTSRQIYRAKHS